MKAEHREASDGCGYLTIWCAPCDTHHMVRVSGPHSWTWNGDVERPTIAPSIRVTYHDGRNCHSTVTDGRIHYNPDTTRHDKAGQTLDLEPLP